MQTEEDVLKELIKEIPNIHEAFNVCVRKSGKTEKLIYLEIGMDAGHWSRCRTGQAHLPPDKWVPIMKICGNMIPLMFLAYQCGFELKPLESSLEQQLKKEREEKEEWKAKFDTLVEALKIANITMK